MRITIYPTGKIKVTAPPLLPEFLIKNFVSKKADWIMGKLEHFKSHPVSPERLLLNSLKRKDYLEQKGKALGLVKERLQHFNQYYGLVYHNVTIRNQKSRWGSCSRRGNLSFNFKILFLKPEVRDYIVVHELCHLKEMNHAKNFWNLVGEQVPDYKELRKKLKGI
jgi:predicted metal-dependent hydrolase